MISLFRPLSVVLLLCVSGVVRAGSSQGAGDASEGAAVRDTVYSLEYVYDRAGEKQAFLWEILDSIDRREAAADYQGTPAYEIQLARAFVASRNLDPSRAIRYLRPLLGSEELSGNPKKHLFALALMCNECNILNRNDEEFDYTLQYMDLARRSGDSVRYASAQLYMALAYQGQRNFTEAFSYLRRAQSILKRTDDPRVLSYELWGREIETELYADQGNYAEAIRRNRQLIARYDALTPQQRKQAGVANDKEMNLRQAQNLIWQACLYAYDGQHAPARESYAHACSLLDSALQVLSPQLNELTYDYLKAAGRYDEALDCAHRYAQETSVGDTVNLFHLSAKRRLAEMYQLMGDYRQAWLYEHQVTGLADSLYARSNREAALELQTIYETSERQAQIQQQQITIARHRHLTLLLLIGLVALGALLWIIWHSRRRIARKNRKLFHQIERLSQARKELERIRSAMNNQKTKRAAVEENDLFDALNSLMRERELFRNPELNRDQVAAELGTNKLYLSNAISECRSMTFSEYLNECRLEYAKEILLSDDTTKIEAIALMCGFNSVRTFYRLFYKHYQLTPSEFRRLSIFENTPDN